MELLPLRLSAPLGVHLIEKDHWNFVVASRNGHAVDLCLFDVEDHQREIARIRLPHRKEDLFYGAVSGLKEGQPYGFRVYGPWNPLEGHWFNPQKLLLDPYAKAVSGEFHAHSSQQTAFLQGDLHWLPDPVDSAAYVPRSLLPKASSSRIKNKVLCDETELVIYELHVRGFSQINPNLPEHLRGTYAGLAHENSIQYFKNLGITALQLMPIHLRVNDLFLQEKGLSNYWGYQSIGFFCADPRFAATNDPLEVEEEFRQMVAHLHAAGIEVILDVVYNHSGEHAAGTGISACFRGFDSLLYYRQPVHMEYQDLDYTGTGNTLDTSNPRMLQLVMDSLRYWVEHMGVDGFRFDLAATLGRDVAGKFGHHVALFKALAQDPVLAQARLIAEPWDLGPFGYQVGGFPNGWQELNGRFRDVVRRFWKGDAGVIGEFAGRITGSEDLYATRGPQASINFVTSHDGFTLHDLVSYQEKHNHANGEDNRDGDSHNHSWNCGVEGETVDPQVVALRHRQQRNFLATMIISQGIPFFSMGDERSRTQHGNNNGYCQDSADFWLSWQKEDNNAKELSTFVQYLLQLRKEYLCFRRRRFLHGNQIAGSLARDVIWFDLDARLMTPAQWNSPNRKHLGLLFAGITATSKHLWRTSDRDPALCILFSAEAETRQFCLPGDPETVRWQVCVDTNLPTGKPEQPQLFAARQPVELLPYHTLILSQCQGTEEQAQQLAD